MWCAGRGSVLAAQPPFSWCWAACSPRHTQVPRHFCLWYLWHCPSAKLCDFSFNKSKIARRICQTSKGLGLMSFAGVKWSWLLFIFNESQSLDNSIAQERIKSTLLVLRQIVLNWCLDWKKREGNGLYKESLRDTTGGITKPTICCLAYHWAITFITLTRKLSGL